MKQLFALIGCVVLLPIAAFCTFGFLATFEPSDTPVVFLAFRIGYAVFGFGCVAWVILLIVKAIRR